MILFNIEMLSSDKSPSLKTSLIKLDAGGATFKNLLNVTVLEECLNKTNIDKVC